MEKRTHHPAMAGTATALPCFLGARAFSSLMELVSPQIMVRIWSGSCINAERWTPASQSSVLPWETSYTTQPNHSFTGLKINAFSFCLFLYHHSGVRRDVIPKLWHGLKSQIWRNNLFVGYVIDLLINKRWSFVFNRKKSRWTIDGIEQLSWSPSLWALTWCALLYISLTVLRNCQSGEYLWVPSYFLRFPTYAFVINCLWFLNSFSPHTTDGESPLILWIREPDDRYTEQSRTL